MLIGESEYRLDLKAIEPYKDVLCHAGYIGDSGLTAVLIFTAMHLPDTNKYSSAEYKYVMHNIFLYIVSTMDLLVAQDYIIIYINGGCKKRNLPGLSWLRQCYSKIDRRLRKSIKKLYVVHPTFYLKALVNILLPILSRKFSRKLFLCKQLKQLYKELKLLNNGVDVDISSKLHENILSFDKNL